MLNRILMKEDNDTLAQKEEPQKVDRYWVTLTYQAHFDELKIKSGQVSEDDTKTGLYYPKTEEGKKAAERMVRVIKQAIFDYNKTQTGDNHQKWITEEWLNNPVVISEE